MCYQGTVEKICQNHIYLLHQNSGQIKHSLDFTQSLKIPTPKITPTFHGHARAAPRSDGEPVKRLALERFRFAHKRLVNNIFLKIIPLLNSMLLSKGTERRCEKD